MENQKNTTTRKWFSVLALVALLGILGVVAFFMFQRDYFFTEDANGDGKADSWIYYDLRAHVHRVEKDRDFNGVVDWIDTFGIDPQSGRDVLIRSEMDLNGDQKFETVIEYSGDQKIKKMTRDSNGDGRIDMISTFDQPGAPPTKVEVDEDFDGKFEKVTTGEAAAETAPADKSAAPEKKEEPKAKP
ncbi:MAG: hypothetical protein GX444_09100 [Myxococcales bacterium]|nr:hypothetical protein [Myxococcales bacterium]